MKNSSAVNSLSIMGTKGEIIHGDEQFDNMESAEKGVLHDVPSESKESNDSDSNSVMPAKPRLVTHLSLMREDSPLLDPSKPALRKPKACIELIWDSYQQSIDNYPLATKSITSAILTAAGEVVSQQITSFGGAVDTRQMWEFFFIGLLLQAPSSHYFYLLLDRELPPTSSPWTWTTFIKLLIDQLIFSPTFLLSLFIFLDALEGLGPMAMLSHLQQSYMTTLVTNWKLWVPATMVNMACIPPAYRVLYNNLVFFVWSIILAMLLLSPADN